MKHIAIIKQYLEGAETNAVNSRDLHDDLSIKTDYSNWIKRSIEKFGFKENQDYIVKSDGVQKIDYIVSLDMAKELCMLANTDEGRNTRRYFIQIENQARSKAVEQLEDHRHKIHSLLEYTDKMGEVVTAHEKIIKENTEDIKEVKYYIEEDMKTRPVSYNQQKMLLDAKNTKVYQIADKDKKVASVMHHKVWSLFKKHFEIPRYNALPTVRFNEGLEYIKNLTLGDLVA